MIEYHAYMSFIVEGVSGEDEPDSKVRRIGAYETRDEAIAVAKLTVDEFLRREYRSRMLSSELFSRYQAQGEHPYVYRDEGATMTVRTFDHSQYAMLRCAEICGGEKSA